MEPIQGILACAGMASRFSGSTSNQPYPKHLELIGDKTLLAHAFESLVTNVPVTGVTFILHPNLQTLYMPHLYGLQQDHRNIELSYAISGQTQTKGITKEDIAAMKENVYTLDGQKKVLGNPIVAFGYGDIIARSSNSEKIQESIRLALPSLPQHTELVVAQNITSGLTVQPFCYITRVDNLSGYIQERVFLTSSKQELQIFNINNRTDLINAKIELGYPLTQEENNERKNPSRKENRF